MPEDGSLLEQVQRIELELNARIAHADKAASTLIEQAIKEGEDMIRHADEEGKAGAATFFQEEMRSLELEIAKNRQEALLREQSLKKTGDLQFSAVVTGIVDLVTHCREL